MIHGLDILVPCKPFLHGKSRLAPILPVEERAALCRTLLRRTLRRARALGGQIAVVGNDPDVQEEARQAGVLALNEAGQGLNAALASANADLLLGPVKPAALLVLPIDLPRAPPAVLRRFLERIPPGQAGLAPDRAGTGTNLLFLPPCLRPGFPFAYGEASAHGHRRSIEARQCACQVVRMAGLARDLDTPEDWADLMRRTDMS